MADETTPPDDESPLPTEKIPEQEPEPEKVEVEKDYLEYLEQRHRKLTVLQARRVLLNAVHLDLRAGIMQDGPMPPEWNGFGPGMYLNPRCGCWKGLEAIYYRGTVALRCRKCKDLAHRIKVAPGASEADAPPPAHPMAEGGSGPTTGGESA